ncbi:MAG: mechanosensitive ion channel [Oscillospiraceae bacterium]|nr:mechanosensitive ion channel [Oscillospiraceae bacterium]
MQETTENILESIVTNDPKPITEVLAGLLAFIKALLPSFLMSAFIFIIGMALIKILMRFIKRALKKSNIDPTAASFLKSLISVILYILVAIIILTVLNVPMTSIIAVISTAGLAIGLALQDSLANVAGGFWIMFSKPLKVGDLVKFDDITGTVKEVGILQTKLILGDDTAVYIPNGKVADAVIVNYSAQSMRRLDLEIGISYDDDVEAAKSLILALIEAHPLAADEPAPLVRIGGFGDNAVLLHVRVWTQNDNYWTLYYDMHEDIKAAFDAHGISFPYPQRDVHVHHVK